MQSPVDIYTYMQLHSAELGNGFSHRTPPCTARRNSVSTSLPDAARALSGTNPGNYGREQAMALGSQRQCRGRVRLWQDAHRAGKHVGA